MADRSLPRSSSKALTRSPSSVTVTIKAFTYSTTPRRSRSDGYRKEGIVLPLTPVCCFDKSLIRRQCSGGRRWDSVGTGPELARSGLEPDSNRPVAIPRLTVTSRTGWLVNRTGDGSQLPFGERTTGGRDSGSGSRNNTQRV